MATPKESISGKGPNQGDITSELEKAPISKKETKKLSRDVEEKVKNKIDIVTN